MPMEELVEVDVEEADKKVGMGEAPPTEDSGPEQAPMLHATLPVVARLWAGGPSDQVARQGPAASLKARGKASIIQLE